MEKSVEKIGRQLFRTKEKLAAERKKNDAMKRRLVRSEKEEKFSRFILSVHEMLLNSSGKMSVVGSALRKLGKLLGADRCCVLTLSRDGKKFTDGFEWTDDPELKKIGDIRKVPVGNFAEFIRILSAGKEIVADDAGNPPAGRGAMRHVPHRDKLKSFFLAGLKNRGCLTGILGVDFCTPGKKIGVSERKIINGFAGVMSLFLARMYARQLVSMAVSSMPAMLFIKDADNGFRYIFGNREFADFLETTPQQLIGQDDSELFKHAPGTGNRLRDEDISVMAGTRRKVFPADCPAPDGTIYYQNTVKYPLRTWDGRNLLAGFTTDISEKHLSEVREKCYSGIFDALLRDKELKDVFEVLFSTIINNIPWCARLVFMRPALVEKYEIVYEKLTGDEYRLPRDVFIRFRNSLGDELKKLGPSGIFFCRDLSRRLPEISDYPYHSCAAVPIYTKKALQGFVIFFSNVVYRQNGAMKMFLKLLKETVTLMFQRLHEKELIKNAESFSEKLLETIQLPIFVYDPDGRIIKVNGAAAKIGLGISRNPFPFKHLFKHEKSGSEEIIRKVFAEGGSAASAALFKGRYYRILYHPIFMNGRIHSIVCCAEDITRLRNKIDNMQKINTFLDCLLSEKNMFPAISRIIRNWGEHLSADWCCLVSYVPGKPYLKCEYQYAGRGSCKIFPENNLIPFDSEAVGPGCFRTSKFIRVEDCSGHIFKEHLESLAEDKEDIRQLSSFYTHCVRQRGKIWGVLAIGFKKTRILTPEEEEFCSAGARCVELMLIQNDYQKKLKQAVLDVQKTEQAKSLFSASMIHEIRTPLNAVIGFADVLQDETIGEEERKEYLHSISAAGNALMSLINDVLDLSKLEAAQMSIVPSLINMRDMIADCRNIFQERCRAKSIRMKTMVDDEMPLLLLDQNRIRQILFNLIGNAVKFTDSGTITVSCSFKPGKKNVGTLNFSVSDTGVGIAKKDQKDIFGLFSQVFGIRGSRTVSGTGIGLALCKRLVDKMNGRILLKSAPGKGSVFTVILPEITFLKKTPVPNRTEEIPEEEEFIPDKKVMIVDDVKLNLKVLSAMFRRKGIQVLEASGAGEAMQLLEKEDVGSILTDLWMPKTNGSELAAAIRRKPEYRNIRIAALTADVDLTSNFDMDVFDAVLQKPVEFPKVLEFLKNCRNGNPGGAPKH